MLPANSVIPINIKLVLISTDTLSIKIEITYVIRAIPARILPEQIALNHFVLTSYMQK